MIPKEKAWFGYSAMNNKITYYCFDYENNKYCKCFFNQCEILSDIIVDNKNRLHSYNDQPLVYKYEYGLEINKLWFQNGILERENPEKPYFIELKKCFYIKDALLEVSINNVIKNLKSLEV
jgi:hypothetical protein